MASSELEESSPLRHSDTNITDRDTVTKIAEITLDHFNQYFDSEIGSLKRELKEDHEFNSEVDYQVSRIKRAAECDESSKVRDIFHDLKEKIHKRNKCIKIADKSPAGWDTVKEYLPDELASDSEDEKKIRSAILELCVPRSTRKKSVSNIRIWVILLGQHMKITHLLLLILLVIIFVTPGT
ncbi:unnamed protein product [Mytilus coruscus]|uniref:Uncharacterized protein n=1 Tax=Mytilus coruscus TaxID=42192 RepID=A0A6J8ANC2_MYTCO|nr:unnamed protein product [Mytilus coruscus]